MKFVHSFTIRPLGPEDAEKFLELHRAAVHGGTGGAYAPDILEAWSGPVDAMRREKYKQLAAEEIRIGAFDGDMMAGLGCLAPLKSELRACYVHPDYGRQGVGSKIVDALEQIACGMGLKQLTLDASTNAEKFYQSVGYESIERTSHTLDNGKNIPSIRMRKILPDTTGLELLKKRTMRLEAGTIWQNPMTRRLILCAAAYVLLAVWLGLIGVKHNSVHAAIPLLGYLFGTVAMPHIKKHLAEKGLKT